jgi:hypothetical protein
MACMDSVFVQLRHLACSALHEGIVAACFHPKNGELMHNLKAVANGNCKTGEAAHPNTAILCTRGNALAIVAELQQQHIMPMPLQPTELCGKGQAHE